MPFLQTKYTETPIKKYKIVQTGAKIQFGGEKEGFTSPAYQVGIEAIVKGVLSKPTSSQATTDIISLEKSFMKRITTFPSLLQTQH